MTMRKSFLFLTNSCWRDKSHNFPRQIPPNGVLEKNPRPNFFALKRVLTNKYYLSEHWQMEPNISWIRLEGAINCDVTALLSQHKKVNSFGAGTWRQHGSGSNDIFPMVLLKFPREFKVMAITNYSLFILSFWNFLAIFWQCWSIYLARLG